MQQLEANALFTVSGLSELCGVPRRTIRHLLKMGRLRGAKVGSVWKIPRSAIHALLAEIYAGSEFELAELEEKIVGKVGKVGKATQDT